MDKSGLTIGRLARAADVGVETIRYYQRRNLLPTPDPKNSAFRHYPVDLVSRIHFIKRAQLLGFSLDEISSLLQLENGKNHKAIQKIAINKLDEIRKKIVDLQRMEEVLSHLIHECETRQPTKPCPIIAALSN